MHFTIVENSFQENAALKFYTWRYGDRGLEFLAFQGTITAIDDKSITLDTSCRLIYREMIGGRLQQPVCKETDKPVQIQTLIRNPDLVIGNEIVITQLIPCGELITIYEHRIKEAENKAKEYQEYLKRKEDDRKNSKSGNPGENDVHLLPTGETQ